MIHLFSNNGLDVVLDVNSAAVHLVDETTAAVVRLLTGIKEDWKADEMTQPDVVCAIEEGLPDVTADEIREITDELNELVKAGRLFSVDPYEELVPKVMQNKTVVKALCLNVAHDCNLACKYCFASEGEYNGERGLMSAEVGKKAIDFLIRESGSHVNLEVDFFGGEPTLNFDVVKEIVRYGRSLEKEHNKKFRFTLTTNGVLLNDDIQEFANKEMSNMVLSIDGRKEVNDRMRPTVNGKGSYDIIVPKFQHFVERRGNKGYYVRGTFTHNNTDFTNDIFHMADLGFTELSMEPVVCKPDDPYALTEEDLPVLYEQYELLAKEMLKREKEGRPITFYHYMIDLTSGPCIYKRISGCGSGCEYFAVTPWGDLYPCHQFVGDESYLMGDIWKGIVNKEKQDEFKLCNAYARPECRDCWAKLYCSGGCAANAYHATGSINGIYEYGCKLFKKRMECAIMMQVDKSLNK